MMGRVSLAQHSVTLVLLREFRPPVSVLPDPLCPGVVPNQAKRGCVFLRGDRPPVASAIESLLEEYNF